jgi:hypothetical protein
MPAMAHSTAGAFLQVAPAFAKSTRLPGFSRTPNPELNSSQSELHRISRLPKAPPAVVSPAYKSFTIRTNATLSVTNANSLTDTNCFLNLHHENDAKPDGIKPANFATVQINPVTSKVIILRP